MKKVIAVALVLVMALSLAACDLFSDDTSVKFEELYTHKDPDGLKYDGRTVLINKDFGPSLEEVASSVAYPDTVKYGDDGSMIGMYDYDPATGIASGYFDLSTGEFVEEVVDLGTPDESLLLTLKGNVTVGSVIYENEDNAVAAYLYFFLGDAADKDAVKSTVENFYGITLTAESDTVLVNAKDETAVTKQFSDWQDLYGQSTTDRSASSYASVLKLDFGLKNYGVNPFKPYDGIKDPEDVKFDKKTFLTSNGGYSFSDASLETDMNVRTDVVYSYEGKVVAHYIYYEFKTKDGADKLMDAQIGNFYGEANRISDTVVSDSIVGQGLTNVLESYIGYGILSDDNVEDYVENVEESFFVMVYEQ